MAGRETRAQFNKVVVPGLFTVAAGEYKNQRYPEIWRDIFRIEKTTKAKEEITYISGLGSVPVKPEGQNIEYDARIQGPSKTWVVQTKALGLRVTKEAIDDDQYNVMRDGAAGLGISMRETRHMDAAELFNLGFSTSYYTSADAAAVFSASHSKVDGTSWSNLNTAASLGYSSLQTAILAFESQTDHRGLKINQTPMMLVVPPALKAKALQLLQSLGQPEGFSNDVNAVRVGWPQIKLVVWPYLTSTTAWFLVGDNAKSDTGLIIFEREGVSFGRATDFDSWDFKMQVWCRYSMPQVCHPIGVSGNAGA